MIDLYTWPTPNGHKIHIMLEETGLDYTVHPIDIRAGEQFGEDFLAISPNNRIPAMIDNDAPGGRPISVFESGAMLVYLGEKTGKFLPDASEPAARYDVMQWLMFQMGGVGPMFGQAGHFRNYAMERVEQDKLQYGIDRYTNEAKRLYGVLDRRLAGNDWVAAGRYSVADMAIWPWCRTPERRGVDHDDYPNVKRWCAQVAARPAVQRAVKVLADVAERPAKHSDEQWSIMFGDRQFQR